MLYTFKDAFSFIEEIGTCLNRKVEVDITDKSPFFVRPYHIKAGVEVYKMDHWYIFLDNSDSPSIVEQ